MPIQVFVDESGGKGQTRHLVLAGPIAPSEDWACFSDEWHRALVETPAIDLFSMREAAALQGRFHGWTATARDAKLRRLAELVNRYAQIMIYFAIDLNVHATEWGARRPKPFKDPYFWPFHCIIMGATFDLWDRGLREPFEIMFDENVVFGPRAKAWYPVIRETIRLREPEAFSIMPVDPMFGSDSDFLPLQAADLLAWMFRNGSRPDYDHAFDWLLPLFSSMDLSTYSGVYDRERVAGVNEESLDHMRRFREDPEYMRALVDKHKDLFGS